MVDMFLRRKKDILKKEDKSFIGDIDKRIKPLCDKINSLDCYTTSSCSGRIVLMIDQEKKGKGLMLKIYHDLISFEELKNNLEELKRRKQDIRFKLESCALHVAFKTFEQAKEFYEKAKLLGWKKAGVIAFDKRFVVEINSSERLDFPIIRDGKILVDDNFLKIIVKDSNEKLKKGWSRIENLEKNLDK